jgi:septum formation protein
MLYLASQSPQRAQLLQQLGLSFAILPSAIDETPLSDEDDEAYVLRLAQEKATTLAKVLQKEAKAFSAIIAADTVVVSDGLIFGKPRDAEEAFRMLKQLQGDIHQVLTGIAVYTPEKMHLALSQSQVKLAALSDATLLAYVACGEGNDKAGAYAIQGQAAAFVEKIEGSYSGIMGLPLHELSLLLNKAGISNSLFVK